MARSKWAPTGLANVWGVGLRRAAGAAVLLPVLALGAPPPTASFTDGTAPGWSLTGGATVDPAHDRDGAGGALRIPPGASALWSLRDENGSGRVDLWIYDDLSRPANPKERRVGPRWGLVQADGRALVVGVIYAPYLSGDTTYAVSDSDGKTWFNVQYTAVRRERGWHKWSFDFAADRGLAIARDDKVLPVQRFDWNRTHIEGFSGVVLLGDAGPAEGQQTVWVDDVSVTLGGPVVVKPVPPPPPPPVVPAEDPEAETVVELLPALRGQHPRLLATTAELPALKQKAAGEGKVFLDKMLAYLDACRPQGTRAYLADATDAQRQGYWRAPTVALHYLLTGDADSLAKARGYLEEFVASEHWETGAEEDSGMAAANIAVGAGILYDTLFADLEPAFREKARQKLLLQARRLYYRGHLMKAGGSSSHYWQNDPHNNHRWHRDAGLAACVLAVAGDGPGDAWILAETRKELGFIASWLPADGSSHESPSYLVFGASHLVLALDLADRCLGTSFLEEPFFRNVPAFRIQTLAPGFRQPFAYGDAGGVGAYNDFLFRCVRQGGQRDLQAAVWAFHEQHWQTRDDGTRGENPAFNFGWLGLLWFDPALQGGSLDALPTSYRAADIGLAIVRDGWEAGGVAALLKCAPYGGHRLNDYRNAHGFRYINVAHDDPDVNQFQIYARGVMVACDDGYAYNKVTAAHNTILVNGRGQKGEGQHWTQPLRGRDQDMTGLAVMTAWKDAGEIVIAEGEGAGAYAGLDRYRRTLIWSKGCYVLLLDDVRGAPGNEITWLVQGPAAEVTNGAENVFRLGRENAAIEVQVAADQPLAGTIITSPADDRGKSMGLRQVRLSGRGRQVRFASVFDAWGRGGVRVALQATAADAATVTVRGAAGEDVWQWQAAPAAAPPAPSGLALRRADGTTLALGPADRALAPGRTPPAARP